MKTYIKKESEKKFNSLAKKHKTELMNSAEIFCRENNITFKQWSILFMNSFESMCEFLIYKKEKSIKKSHLNSELNELLGLFERSITNLLESFKNTTEGRKCNDIH